MATDAGDAVAAEKDWDSVSSTAYEALGSVSKSDRTEMKSLNSPPAGVKSIMEAAMIALDYDWRKTGSKDSWSGAKKLLASPKFLTTFREFDPKTINAKMLADLKPFMEDEALKLERLEKVSKACAALCAWVHAVYDYGSM
eukprot:4194475-Prymnesium_polylepis.1